MTLVRTRRTDRNRTDRWALVIECPRCGEDLLSARSIPADVILAAHHRYGCSES